MRVFKVIKVVGLAILAIIFVAVVIGETTYVDVYLRYVDTTVEGCVFIAVVLIGTFIYNMVYKIVEHHRKRKETLSEKNTDR